MPHALRAAQALSKPAVLPVYGKRRKIKY